MDWYVEQSEHNLKSSRYLARENPLYIDWEITTLFYSALHAVNHYLGLVKKKKPRNHIHRKNLIRSELEMIFYDYDLLRVLSQKARYDTPSNRLTLEELNAAVKYHDKITNFVRQQLQRSGRIHDMD